MKIQYVGRYSTVQLPYYGPVPVLYRTGSSVRYVLEMTQITVGQRQLFGFLVVF